MKILIAEDDPVSRRLLEATLGKWGYEVTSTSNGTDAWEVLAAPQAPKLAILDWMMPEMDGVEVCRRVRGRPDQGPLHILLLTARGRKEDVIAGLGAGADDYITKPFDQEELRARVQVGVRIVELQTTLAARVQELEEALVRLKSVRPDVRVVLSSGYDEADATRRFTGKGLAGFVQKPYTAASLAETMKSALERSSRAVH